MGLVRFHSELGGFCAGAGLFKLSLAAVGRLDDSAVAGGAGGRPVRMFAAMQA